MTRPLDDRLGQPLSADDGDDVASIRRHSIWLVFGLITVALVALALLALYLTPALIIAFSATLRR